MIKNILLLLVGFIILIKGADYFVDGASNVAVFFKVPKIFIALTIVAFGTSLPELAISFKSVLSHNEAILFGDIIGSNISNILLILGISCMIRTLNIDKDTLKKQMPIGIVLTIVFSLLIIDNVYSKFDAMIVLIIFIFFLYQVIKTSLKSEEYTDKNKSLIKSILYIIIGIPAITLGSNAIVDSVRTMALYIGISERIIALTIVAFGTSLPELTTSIVASIKGEADIAVGNIIGSNIFNIGIVSTIPIILFGKVLVITNIIDLIFMILSIILLYIFSLRHRLTIKNGIVFLLIFIIYYLYLI